ncbi:MAG: FAD-binding oxidoreductase [Terriglobales bacterium]
MPDNLIQLANSSKSASVDSVQLAAALKRRVHGEVRFDSGSRALYATDASNYRQVPIGVVLPRDANDVIATVATAREYGAPILCRGGGTSLGKKSSKLDDGCVLGEDQGLFISI